MMNNNTNVTREELNATMEELLRSIESKTNTPEEEYVVPNLINEELDRLQKELETAQNNLENDKIRFMTDHDYRMQVLNDAVESCTKTLEENSKRFAETQKEIDASLEDLMDDSETDELFKRFMKKSAELDELIDSI